MSPRSIKTNISFHGPRRFLDEEAGIQSDGISAVIGFRTQGTTWENGDVSFTFFVHDRKTAQEASDMFRQLSRLIDSEILSNEFFGRKD